MISAERGRHSRRPHSTRRLRVNQKNKGVTGIYARWHMFEEKRKAVLAIEVAMMPSIT